MSPKICVLVYFIDNNLAEITGKISVHKKVRKFASFNRVDRFRIMHTYIPQRQILYHLIYLTCYVQCHRTA